MNGKPIVLDNGSYMCRAGFAGQENPRSTITSSTGQIRKSININNLNLGTYVGNSVLYNLGILSLNYPIVNGIVYNWDDMEKLFYYQFYNELKIDPSEHPILISEPANVPKANREKMIQIIFETFCAHSFTLQSQEVLSLYKSGCLTGLSFVSGEGCSTAVPVYEGYKIPHAIKSSSIAGKKLNEWLDHLLRNNGHYFDTPSEKEYIRKTKEYCCYVSLDYNNELKNIYSSRCYYSDDIYISLLEEMIMCPEILFRPELFSINEDGIHKMILNSIDKCNIDIHSDLLKRIYISGGTTKFEGFGNRLEIDIRSLTSKNDSNKITVMSPNHIDLDICSWQGGSIVASMDAFSSSFISRDYYNDGGCGIVHHLCL